MKKITLFIGVSFLFMGTITAQFLEENYFSNQELKGSYRILDAKKVADGAIIYGDKADIFSKDFEYDGINHHLLFPTEYGFSFNTLRRSFIMKVNISGERVWETSFDNLDEVGELIQTTVITCIVNDGYVYGISEGNYLDPEVRIFKLEESTGEIIYENIIGDSNVSAKVFSNINEEYIAWVDHYFDFHRIEKSTGIVVDTFEFDYDKGTSGLIVVNDSTFYGHYDKSLFKYDKNLNIVWQNEYSNQQYNDFAKLFTHSNNTYVITAEHNSKPAKVIKFDPIDGAALNELSLPTSSGATDIYYSDHQIVDNNIYIGWWNRDISYDKHKFVFSKVNLMNLSLGAYGSGEPYGEGTIWGIPPSSSSYNSEIFLKDIEVDENGDAYLTGQLELIDNSLNGFSRNSIVTKFNGSTGAYLFEKNITADTSIVDIFVGAGIRTFSFNSQILTISNIQDHRSYSEFLGYVSTASLSTNGEINNLNTIGCLSQFHSGVVDIKPYINSNEYLILKRVGRDIELELRNSSAILWTKTFIYDKFFVPKLVQPLDNGNIVLVAQNRLWGHSGIPDSDSLHIFLLDQNGNQLEKYIEPSGCNYIFQNPISVYPLPNNQFILANEKCASSGDQKVIRLFENGLPILETNINEIPTNFTQGINPNEIIGWIGYGSKMVNTQTLELSSLPSNFINGPQKINSVTLINDNQILLTGSPSNPVAGHVSLFDLDNSAELWSLSSIGLGDQKWFNKSVYDSDSLVYSIGVVEVCPTFSNDCKFNLHLSQININDGSLIIDTTYLELFVSENDIIPQGVIFDINRNLLIVSGRLEKEIFNVQVASDAFILSIDSVGNIVENITLSGDYHMGILNSFFYSEATQLYMDADNNIIIGGSRFTQDLTFSGFIHKYQPLGIEIISPIENLNLSNFADINIYPNPNLGEINISKSPNYNHPIHFKIFNYTGEEITKNKKLSSNNTQVNLSSLPSGVYFAHFSSNGLVWIEKIIIL